ncbi:RNA polymerase sigma factor [Brevibacillus laterosporus]|uniref:RNA polymerase sigma factor n=1 Tax=Brevibacillus laterosporus LMG 15441 TaxID=1042163 RepID=A0A075R522_BRELA|nr:RNA polymerase sigma factor [Brevibacillus laterosporus]AIG26939.1 RNA polymerase sigma factor, sigma-70 family protein [Brevibacillus laterosporus LMG 15441]RJL14611.1 RNA polymerase sigma factor [Brevibacillus laterosporus]TPH09577.1 RNA polymerase sigma factor [Brevibacillus laterosporus]
MECNHEVERLFVHYKNDIYNYLVYYTGRTDVEDLVQEVFIKVLTNLHRFEYKSNPKTWLFSIARHAAIDFYRKKKVKKLLSGKLFHHLISTQKTPDEALEASEESRELHTAISKLKKAYRDVVILRGIQRLTGAETAEILGWSQTRVNVTMHRAMKQLEKELLHSAKGGIRHESFS